MTKQNYFTLCLHFILILVSAVLVSCQSKSSSDVDASAVETLQNTRYLLYDVNPPEGFNLRRDVYMRIAVLVRHLQDMRLPWKLVLPPWGNMYHWQSDDVGEQNQLPWARFFDIPSMEKFIPVIEMHQFVKEYGTDLDSVYFLQHFTSAWEDGKWEEKMSIETCHENLPYRNSDNKWTGWFWGYKNISAVDVKCLSFQGHATSLIPLLINLTARSVVLDRAEVALHHMFGDTTYWQVRRSMRFAPHLQSIAKEFRLSQFSSTDQLDDTERPADWRLENKVDTSVPRGGNYICVHLRRRDFVWGRSKQIPSIPGAASQIREIFNRNQNDLSSIFIATDAPDEEVGELETLLSPLRVVLFRPSEAQRRELQDGGAAAVEQIICSHARLFYGTHESTFSFRIQEEREMMGFNPDATFNRLCGDQEPGCAQPTRWRIEY